MTSESKGSACIVQNIPLYSLTEFKKWSSLFRALNGEMKLSFFIVNEPVKKEFNRVTFEFGIVEHWGNACWWTFKMGQAEAVCYVTQPNRNSRQSMTIQCQKSQDFAVMIPKDLSPTPTVRHIQMTEEELFGCLLLFAETRDFLANVKIELNTTMILKEVDIEEITDT